MPGTDTRWTEASADLTDAARWFPRRPERPTVATVSPAPDGRRAWEALPVVPLRDDAVLTQWLFACPVDAGTGRRIAESLALGPPAAELAERFRAVPPHVVVAESWPDLTDAIDLCALGEGRPGIRSVFCAAIENDRSCVVRVCHGAAGMNTEAAMWIGGRSVAHGELVRLEPGRHPVVMEVYHGHDGDWIRWGVARLAPRFTEVTEAEIADVHQWRVSLWEATMGWSEEEDRRLLADVRIDPATLRGTEGFFRVARSVNGRWWLIAPDGRPFYHRGCTGLNAGGTGGRRAGLPPVAETAVREWIGYLKGWEFNALGAWTTPEFFDKGMPYAETIEGYYVGPWLEEKFPDVFDPAWEENLDAKCRSLCAPLRESRELIGYFLDNERGFMEVLRPGLTIVARSPTFRYAGPVPPEGLDLAAEPKLNVKGIGLLQFCLSLDGERSAARRAWAFVLERHGSLEALGRAWDVPLPDRGAVRQMTLREEIMISEAYLRDLHDFVRAWVAQYYRVFSVCIRRHDPNHLLLGMRHGGTPGRAVLEAESEPADIVSRNNYRAAFYEAFDECYRECRRPILNGEVALETDAFRLVRNPIEPPGGLDEASRFEERGRDAMDRICSHPGVVGYTKYRWEGGGGDKIWHEGRVQMPVVLPLWQANRRAVRLAAKWDRPPVEKHAPLTGQVFLTLQGGSISVHELPAAMDGRSPSLHVQAGEVTIGLVCQSDTWDGTVYGDGIRGRVLAQVHKGRDYSLSLRVKGVPGIIGREPASAEYTIDLTRNDTHFAGTFSGTYNGHPARGTALGYLYRPVATVRL